MSDGPRAVLSAHDCSHKRDHHCTLIGRYCGDHPDPKCPKLTGIPVAIPQPNVIGGMIVIPGGAIYRDEAEQLATALLIAARKVRNE